MARKTSDPKLIRLLDQRQKAHDEAERWYTRLRRAFNRHERARRKVARLSRRIDAHEAERRQP